MRATSGINFRQILYSDNAVESGTIDNLDISVGIFKIGQVERKK